MLKAVDAMATVVTVPKAIQHDDMTCRNLNLPGLYPYTLTHVRNLIQRHHTSLLHWPISRNPATGSECPKAKIEVTFLVAKPKAPPKLNTDPPNLNPETFQCRP